MAEIITHATPASIASALLGHIRETDDLPSAGWFLGYMDAAQAVREEPDGIALQAALVLLARCWSQRQAGTRPKATTALAALRTLRRIAGEED